MPKLVLPSSQYKQSYLEAIKEYQADLSHARWLKAYTDLDTQVLEQNFNEYIVEFQNEAQGVNLPSGYVPHTVYWLVEGNDFLGRVDIRHTLNDFLKKAGGHIGYDIRPSQRQKGYGKLALKLAIQKAHELGIQDVLLSCDVGNIGSNKVIQANGGKLAGTYQLPDKTVKNRYWIADEKIF